MPPKVRELVSDLKKAGFRGQSGKGSHWKFTHPKVSKPVVISGNPGDDALDDQQKATRNAIEESRR